MEIAGVDKFLGENNEVLFRPHGVHVRYYYKLERAVTGTYVTYSCYDGEKLFYSLEIRHIDDARAWFFMRDEEKIINRLYRKAHIMAKKALISAEINGV